MEIDSLMKKIASFVFCSVLGAALFSGRLDAQNVESVQNLNAGMGLIIGGSVLTGVGLVGFVVSNAALVRNTSDAYSSNFGSADNGSACIRSSSCLLSNNSLYIRISGR